LDFAPVAVRPWLLQFLAIGTNYACVAGQSLSILISTPGHWRRHLTTQVPDARGRLPLTKTEHIRRDRLRIAAKIRIDALHAYVR